MHVTQVVDLPTTEKSSVPSQLSLQNPRHVGALNQQTMGYWEEGPGWKGPPPTYTPVCGGTEHKRRGVANAYPSSARTGFPSTLFHLAFLEEILTFLFVVSSFSFFSFLLFLFFFFWLFYSEGGWAWAVVE